jgi:signal transduction histidine kinase/CheY-like chemotaxis protein
MEQSPMSQTTMIGSPEVELRQDLRARVMSIMLAAQVLFGTLLIMAAEALGAPLASSLLGFWLIALALAAWSLLKLAPSLAAWLLVAGALGLGASQVASSHLVAGLVLLAIPGALGVLMLGPLHGFGFALAGALLIVLLPDAAAAGISSSIEAIQRLVAIFVIWTLTGLVWTATRSAAEAMHWWSHTYEQMRALLEEARTQRVHLKQIQDDLLQANQELTRVSERLRAMREVAEDARRTKEQFVANVSHELRTPLNMIIGFTEMIARAPHVYGRELPEQLLADVEVVLSSSQHLSSLVDDVLDLSQVDSGQMAISKEWCDLNSITQAAVRAITPLFEHKGLELTVAIASDLPSVYCDPVRIRQVILNLLSNAGRFTEKGGAYLTLGVAGQQVQISVRDTGPGISGETQARIFEPFAQADGSIRRRYGGSGLGLAISKQFIELHGGRLWFESDPGAGTTFHFSLPIETPTPLPSGGVQRWLSSEAEFARQPVASLAPKPRVGPRYVVLESSNTLSRLLTRYHHDAEIVTVRTMEQAADELNRLPAHALLLNDNRFENASLPAEQLGFLAFGTPVIACWVPGEAEVAERLGLVRYLIKPVRRQDLLDSIATLGSEVQSVLVVDDEPEALQLYARILGSAGRGYRILRAPSGERALTLLRTRHPDVMLLDLVMPCMDGYTLLRTKSLDPAIRDIPTIAVSAQDPTGGPIASSSLTILRSGGLHLRDLLNTIQLASQTLAPPDRLDPAPAKSPPA